MKDKLRWGVLGAGGIADRRTLPGMMLAENAQLVAVMEIDSGNAERLRAKYGALRAYTDEEALCADPEVDAVYIATPVFLHARQARMAAAHGKHILIEKPVGLTAQEAQAVVEACEQKGVKIGVGFMMRFGAGVQAMKRAIAEGKIGQVVSGYGQFTCWYPDMPDNWRQKRSEGGGGALTDMGVHLIDLIQYVSGSRVRQVAAFHDTQTFSYEVEDASSVLLRLENGVQCVIQSNFNIPDQAAKWRLEFFGTRGRLLGDEVIGQVDGGRVEALILPKVDGYDAVQDGQRAKPEVLTVQTGNLYTREIESFSHSILTGTALAVPARDAVYVQKIVEAAYRANDEGRAIELSS